MSNYSVLLDQYFLLCLLLDSIFAYFYKNINSKKHSSLWSLTSCIILNWYYRDIFFYWLNMVLILFTKRKTYWWVEDVKLRNLKENLKKEKEVRKSRDILTNYVIQKPCNDDEMKYCMYWLFHFKRGLDPSVTRSMVALSL
jgi:hypothetical protein